MAIPLIGIAIGGLILASQLKGFLDLFPPIGIKYNKWALSKYPVNIPTLNELCLMRFKGTIDEPTFFSRCKENGFSEELAVKFFDAQKNLLSAADYITLYRREEITEEVLNQKLTSLQFSEDTISQAVKVTEFFPNANDLVRFAVREVFTPATAEKFGQYEDLPQKFLDLAAKTGLTKEVASWYWAAHWGLPSPGMGYQMLQRRIITHDELSMLLKALDIMPYWRDKLIQLSYHPLTRVDVRRMYRTDVLNAEEVNEAHLDAGYSPDNAAKMTTFVTRETTEEGLQVTVSNLATAYKKDIITLEQYKSYLKELQYNPESIVFMINSVEYDKKMDGINILVKEYTSSYKQGMITLEDINIKLNQHDLPATFVTSTVNKIKNAVSEKTKIPTQSDLTTWLKLGMIDDKTFMTRMLNIGYTKLDTEMYVSEIALKQDVTKVKYLGTSKYIAWAKKGLIDISRLQIVLTELNLSQADIAVALQEAQATPAKKEEKA